MFRQGDGASLDESWTKSPAVQLASTINETHAANDAKAYAIALTDQLKALREFYRRFSDTADPE
jgi:hypothetical protein